MSDATKPTPTQTAAVMKAFDKIPPPKKRMMKWRTFVGACLIFTGISMANGWMFCNQDGCLPLTWAFTTFGLGWLVVSGQVIMHPIRLAIARFSDFQRAKRGEPIATTGNGDTSEHETER